MADASHGNGGLLAPPGIHLTPIKTIKKWWNHANVSQKKLSIPWYLTQSTKELLRSFYHIKKEEDERIHEAVTFGTKSPWSMHISASNKQSIRDRYTNIKPWDKNRVVLETIDDSMFNDYINASHMKLSLPLISKYNRYYIATQGPTETTTPHFWQMCYQNSDPTDEFKPIVIAMLTPLVEDKIQKCFPYWPNGENYDAFVLDTETPTDEGFPCSLKISFKSKESFMGYTHSILSIDPIARSLKTTATSFDISNYKPKEVHHFYFEGWSDFSHPSDYSTLLQLSKHMWEINGDPNIYRPSYYNENPLYVHCSAGVGRTGTFMSLDYLLNCCDDFQENSDASSIESLSNSPTRPQKSASDFVDPIYEIVSSLRAQRMSSVQSRSQYLFLYDTAETVYQKKHGLLTSEDESDLVSRHV